MTILDQRIAHASSLTPQQEQIDASITRLEQTMLASRDILQRQRALGAGRPAANDEDSRELLSQITIIQETNREVEKLFQNGE